jgi:hypothetical protein
MFLYIEIALPRGGFLVTIDFMLVGPLHVVGSYQSDTSVHPRQTQVQPLHLMNYANFILKCRVRRLCGIH